MGGEDWCGCEGSMEHEARSSPTTALSRRRAQAESASGSRRIFPDFLPNDRNTRPYYLRDTIQKLQDCASTLVSLQRRNNSRPITTPDKNCQNPRRSAYLSLLYNEEREGSLKYAPNSKKPPSPSSQKPPFPHPTSSHIKSSSSSSRRRRHSNSLRNLQPLRLLSTNQQRTLDLGGRRRLRFIWTQRDGDKITANPARPNGRRCFRNDGDGRGLIPIEETGGQDDGFKGRAHGISRLGLGLRGIETREGSVCVRDEFGTLGDGRGRRDGAPGGEVVVEALGDDVVGEGPGDFVEELGFAVFGGWREELLFYTGPTGDVSPDDAGGGD